jgi:hypothetical protein|tara:strand:- start:37 stop:519 length:483 start_codon:yes stop_codon:yes gene_type:complete
MKVRGVFPVGILLILLWGGSSSFAQKYKGDIAEYKVNESIYSEGYQQGISLGKAKTSAGKYFWKGSGVGFVTTTLAILPGIPSFFATPYLLKGSKMPEEDYQKAQSRGADYLESFQAGWKKETRSKKRTYYRWGHVVGTSVGVVAFAYFLSINAQGMAAY